MSDVAASEPNPSGDTRRDRRDDGRPEQSRPRDRTGRPLPYGTTGVPLTQEHDPADVEHALDLGAELWSQARFFEAHECLEQVWHAAPVEDADLWQGVIQIAVAGVHLQRDNRAGATTLLQRAADRLEAYPDGHRGITVVAARARCKELIAALGAGTATNELLVGGFPAAPGGAWFSPAAGATTPPTARTPLPDGPAWLAAGQPRRARLRG